MPLFTRKNKSKSSSDDIVLTQEDEIVAYIDEVFRKRISVQFTIKGKQISANILFMDSKNKAMRIQMDGYSQGMHGMDVMAGFALDRTWWSFKTKLVGIQDKPHLLIPKAIAHNERRKMPRTSFTSREQVKVTVMEGLGSGHGVFGMANDVSTGGICLTIEKAMVLANEKEISPSPTLFKPGARLGYVKINRVPGTQAIETSGIAKRVYRDGKWKCAIELDKLSKPDRTGFARFIEPRVLEFKFVKRSMKKREEIDARRAESPSMSGRPGAGPAAAPPPGNKAPAPPKAKKAAAPPPSGPAAATQAPAPPAPTGAPKPPTQAAAPEAGPKTKVLVIGESLLNELPFLEDADCPFTPLVGSTPVNVIRLLTEENPPIILCGSQFKGRSSIVVLERITNMGMAENRKIFVCSKDLQSKDRIKFKMMKIGRFVGLPVKDKQGFFNRLNEK